MLAPLLGLLLASTSARAEDLNTHVMAVIERIPADGRYPYAWDRQAHTDGVMAPVAWGDATLASPDGAGVHCSGVTFEVYVRALQRALGSPAPDLAPHLQAMKDTWYVRTNTERGPVDALVEAGLATPVTRLEDLQPGDFLQFWRNNGNGHSAVFTGFRTTRSGALRSLVFWSAQSSSGGVGRRYVSVGHSDAQITPGRWYAARAVVPPSPDEPR